jgi:hypothetical protein
VLLLLLSLGLVDCKPLAQGAAGGLRGVFAVQAAIRGVSSLLRRR